MAALAVCDVDFRGRKEKMFYRPKTSDEGILRDIFPGGAYDLGRLKRGPELLDFVASQSRDGRNALVVDAGANIGAASLFFSLLLGKSRVVAVESSPETYKVLERNAVGRNIRCIHGAISATRGLAQAFDPHVSGGFLGHRAKPLDEGAPAAGKILGLVPRVTINDIYAEEGERAFPFIVKVDIEGGEADLFSRDIEWVEKTPIVIVELHDWLLPKQGIAGPFLRCIAGLDRDFVPLGENIFSLANRLV